MWSLQCSVYWESFGCMFSCEAAGRVGEKGHPKSVLGAPFRQNWSQVTWGLVILQPQSACGMQPPGVCVCGNFTLSVCWGAVVCRLPRPPAFFCSGFWEETRQASLWEFHSGLESAPCWLRCRFPRFSPTADITNPVWQFFQQSQNLVSASSSS